MKAAVELPSPFAGRRHRAARRGGRDRAVGTPIISIDTVGVAPARPAGRRRRRAADAAATGRPGRRRPVPTRRPVGGEADDAWSGYGPARGDRRRAVGGRPAAEAVAVAGGRASAVGVNAPRAGHRTAPGTDRRPRRASGQPPAAAARGRAARAAWCRPRSLAKPPVRKLAKTLGVDLARSRPTGPNGTISRDDVTGRRRLPAPDAPPAPVTAASRRRRDRASARPASRSRACASTPPPPWSSRRSPHRTSPSSSPSTSPRRWSCATASPRAASSRDVKVSPLLFVAKAVILAAAAHAGDQRDAGTTRPARSSSSTTSTSASPRRPSAG